jgi:3-dehydrosphinganine reductase
MTPQHAIITGGSSGIGLAIARQLASRGSNITIIARNVDRLTSAKAEIEKARASTAQRIVPQRADVSSEVESRIAVSNAVVALGPPQLLITSAGAGGFVGRFEDAPLEEFERVMTINYLGSVYPTRAVLPHMNAQRDGHICFVSSGAGLIGVYGYSAYSPTKFALRGLADVLRAELKQDNIRVSICYPPDTDTPMLQKEIAMAPPETRAIAASAGLWSADQVAAVTLRGIDANRFEISCGAELKALQYFRGIASTGINAYLDWLVARSRRAGAAAAGAAAVQPQAAERSTERSEA